MGCMLLGCMFFRLYAENGVQSLTKTDPTSHQLCIRTAFPFWYPTKMKIEAGLSIPFPFPFPFPFAFPFPFPFPFAFAFPFPFAFAF